MCKKLSPASVWQLKTWFNAAEAPSLCHTQDGFGHAAALHPNSRNFHAASAAHHLSHYIAYATYQFLNGPRIMQVRSSELEKMGAEKSQQSVGLFAKKRRPNMLKFLQKALDDAPDRDWAQLVVDVT